MRNSSNPALKRLKSQTAVGFGTANPATYGGIGLKVFYYLIVTLVAAVGFVALFPSLLESNPTLASGLLIGCFIAALVSGIVAAFAPKTSAVSGTIYCVAEGALVGLISSLFEAVAQGVVIVALLATMLTLAVTALLYFTGVVRVGTKFRRFIFVALLSLVVSQLAFWLLSLLVPSVGMLYAESFVLQIIVSAVVIVIAALTMFVDFDNMTMIVENGLDKSYEWMAAYGLMVTLIWLYIEILRLVAIIFAHKD